MAYKALTHVLRGHAPAVEPGEIVPEHYLDMHGEPQPVDFERLLELGHVEKVSARTVKTAAKPVEGASRGPRCARSATRP